MHSYLSIGSTAVAALAFCAIPVHANLLTVNPGFEAGERYADGATMTAGGLADQVEGWLTFMSPDNEGSSDHQFYTFSTYPGWMPSTNTPGNQEGDFHAIMLHTGAMTHDDHRAAVSAGTSYTLALLTGNLPGHGWAEINFGIQWFDGDGTLIDTSLAFGSRQPFQTGFGLEYQRTANDDPLLLLEHAATAPEGAASAGAYFETAGGWTIVDDVRLIPEPASAAMLALGSLALLVRRGGKQ